MKDLKGLLVSRARLKFRCTQTNVCLSSKRSSPRRSRHMAVIKYTPTHIE
jgi:hypothetical protein